MSVSTYYFTNFDDGTELITGRENECEGEKGSGFVVYVVCKKYLATQLRKSDGECIQVGDPKLIEQTDHYLYIIPSMLDNLPECKCTLEKCLIDPGSYFPAELKVVELDISTPQYLVKQLIPHVVRLAGQKKDKEVKLYKVMGILGLVREEVYEEKEVIGLLKKERRLHLPYGNDGGDDDEDDDECSICMTELLAGDECARTPCSHVFHYGCILPWLIENTACPNCRRIVR